MVKKSGSKGRSGKSSQDEELEALRRRVVELEQSAAKAGVREGLSKRDLGKASA